MAEYGPAAAFPPPPTTEAAIAVAWLFDPPATTAKSEAPLPIPPPTVENWASLGPARALTGPVARGDDVTIARQREAIAERAEDLLPLFDALTQATRDLAGETEPALR